MKLKIQSLSPIGHAGAQEPHVASSHCVGQHRCETLPQGQNVLLDNTAGEQWADELWSFMLGSVLSLRCTNSFNSYYYFMDDVGFIIVLIIQTRETKAQSDSKSPGHRLQARRPDLSSVSHTRATVCHHTHYSRVASSWTTAGPSLDPPSSPPYFRYHQWGQTTKNYFVKNKPWVEPHSSLNLRSNSSKQFSKSPTMWSWYFFPVLPSFNI